MSLRPSNTSRSTISSSLPVKIQESVVSLKTPIRIMSFNVNFGGVNYDGALSYNGQRVLKAMEENVENVDLICLQETHIGWEIAVSNSGILANQFPNQAWDHSKTNVYLASGSGVLAKANLNLDVDMLSSNVEGSYFDAMHIIVTRKNSKLEDSSSFCNYQVLNLHLRPPLSFEGGNLQHVSAFLYQTIPVRKNEVDSYTKQALEKCSYPLIILGDFNESSQSGIFQTNYASLLKDMNFHDFIENQTTWYWPLKGPFSLWGSYDHIFGRKDQFKLLSSKVLSEYKEMHLIIYLVLSLWNLW